MIRLAGCNRSIRLTEEKLASYLGVKHVLLTSMGRTALVICLKALGIGPEDEVVLPSFTCEIVTKAVEFCGARPVFADVDAETFNVDPKEIQRSITKNTKAIVVIHCYGQPADLNEIIDIAHEKEVSVIEDVAHSLGAEYQHNKVGTFGHFSIFSFSKSMNCSSGGALVTNSSDLSSKAREVLKDFSIHEKKIGRIRYSAKRGLLSFGKRGRVFLSSFRFFDITRLGVTRRFQRYVSNVPRVFNADERIAVEVIAGLEKIDQLNQRRRENAQVLTELIEGSKLASVKCPVEKKDRTHVYYLYGLKVSRRNEMLRGLGKLEKYVHLGLPWQCQHGSQAKKLSNELMLLELNPDLSNKGIDLIVSTLTSSFKS